MSTTHVVVVEDEPKIAQLVADYLRNDGFHVTVLREGSICGGNDQRLVNLTFLFSI